MGAKGKPDPELEKLVQLVKTEMIEEGLRYSGNVIGRPRAVDKPRRVNPGNGKYVLRDKHPIQFRGTPRRKSVE